MGDGDWIRLHRKCCGILGFSLLNRRKILFVDITFLEEPCPHDFKDLLVVVDIEIDCRKLAHDDFFAQHGDLHPSFTFWLSAASFLVENDDIDLKKATQDEGLSHEIELK